MPRPTLDATEIRVLGALAEKSLATPDHYPLTMNGLVAACNQKSSRDPVTDLSEREVGAAVERLMRRGLAGTTAGAGHRVAKVRHLLDRALDLSRRELAALTVLMLRGPQTAGEINTRSGRLADFAGADDVEETLWLLGDRDEPLAVRLDREPGQSADRYAHQLSGDVEAGRQPGAEADRDDDELRQEPTSGPHGAGSPSLDERVRQLEEAVAQMQAELAAFRAQFE